MVVVLAHLQGDRGCSSRGRPRDNSLEKSLAYATAPGCGGYPHGDRFDLAAHWGRCTCHPDRFAVKEGENVERDGEKSLTPSLLGVSRSGPVGQCGTNAYGASLRAANLIERHRDQSSSRSVCIEIIDLHPVSCPSLYGQCERHLSCECRGCAVCQRETPSPEDRRRRRRAARFLGPGTRSAGAQRPAHRLAAVVRPGPGRPPVTRAPTDQSRGVAAWCQGFHLQRARQRLRDTFQWHGDICGRRGRVTRMRRAVLAPWQGAVRRPRSAHVARLSTPSALLQVCQRRTMPGWSARRARKPYRS